MSLPTARYLDAFMRLNSAVPLTGLFSHAHAPAKEITESYAAYANLQPHLRKPGPLRVLHIGDGAHCRTGALFSYLTHAENISIDPAVNTSLVGAWRNRWNVQRFEWWKCRIEDALARIAALPPMRTVVTLVHAHVDTDEVLSQLSWEAAYTMACCHPAKQLSKRFRAAKEGEDESCLAHQRRLQVLVSQ